jgi:dihydrofolate reductase
MRKVTYGGAVSLDGFLAGPDGAIDWLHFSKDVQEITTTYLKDVDTILMGRKTFEAGGSGTGTAKTYVFSRTLSAIAQPGVELIRDDPVPFVRILKRQPGRGICVMGGGLLAQTLLAADLIDEIGLNIHPILLGSGIPAFRDAGNRVRLDLTECRPIHGGCVLANYTVRH